MLTDHQHNRLQLLSEIAEARNFYFQWFSNGYAEPGYQNDGELVALADWNDKRRYNGESQRFETIDKSPSRIASLLEQLGFDLQWEDEWSECTHCNRLIRTQPDGYGWKPSYVILNECEIVCHLCVPEFAEEVLELYISNPRNALTFDLDVPGFTRLEGGFENGLHEGQADDPKVIAKSLEELGVTRYLFKMDDVGQFDVTFSVWVDNDQLTREVWSEWETAKKSADISPATMMKRALQEASVKMSQLEGDGIKYAQCNPDGTADVRLVSNDEFIKGIK